MQARSDDGTVDWRRIGQGRNLRRPHLGRDFLKAGSVATKGTPIQVGFKRLLCQITGCNPQRQDRNSRDLNHAARNLPR